MRGWLTFLLLLGLAASGYWFWQDWQAQSASENTTLERVRIEPGDIEETVTAQGKVEPRRYVDVGVQVTGQLMHLHVALGDEVRQGQLIAEIDPRVFEARVAATTAERDWLKAQLAEQEAEVDLAEQLLERTRRLIAEAAVSQEELQTREAGLKVARARVLALQAQIQQVKFTLEGDQTNLGFTKVFAPINGTVVVQSAREGQTLNANQQAPVIVQVANLDEMTVRAQAAEADVPRIKPGGKVYFTTLGGQGRRWEGAVRQVLPSPEVVSDVVLYNALVDVDNRDRGLMTGMTAQMFFVLDEAKQVPLLPSSALRERVPGADAKDTEAWEVEVAVGPTSERRVIQVGLKTRARVEVRQGLQPGDEVLVARPKAVGTSGGMRIPPRI